MTKRKILSSKFSILLILPILAILGDRDVQVLRVHYNDRHDHFNATVEHRATVFFLHGQGGSGTSMKNWVKAIRGYPPTLAYIKWIFPTAPRKPYAWKDGEVRHVWIDRKVISPEEPEDLESMELSIQGLSDIIYEEEHAGIPIHNMVIGGFSTGGQMALHMAFRFFPQMRGVFALSSFLPNDSIVYQHLRQNKLSRLPTAYLSTNEAANQNITAAAEWTENTANWLSELGVNATYEKIGCSDRLIDSEQLLELINWLERTLE